MEMQMQVMKSAPGKWQLEKHAHESKAPLKVTKDIWTDVSHRLRAS
jgi:hypothetical protein